jgi:ribosome biogenesis GTPase
MIIDTPGMRAFAMIDSDGIGETFADVEQYLGKCKFSNCGHRSEPGCAIKAAIANGTISRERWDSYMQLKNEAKYNDDRIAFIRAQREQWKKWGREARNKKKSGGRRT